MWFRRRLTYERYVAIESMPDGIVLVVQSGLDAPRFEHVSISRCELGQQAEVLAGMVRELGLKGLPCSVVLNTEQYSVQSLERPNVEPEEMSQAVRWKIREYVEGDLSQWVVDWYDVPEDGTRGRARQVVAVMARRSAVERIIGIVRESGLILDTIDIATMALRNLLAVQPETHPGLARAVLWVRDNEALIDFTKDNAVYLSRRVEVDLNALADPDQRDWVGQNLALEVQRSMDYFDSQMRQAPPRALHVLANSQVDVLRSQLNEGLGLDVVLLDVPGVELELAGEVALAAGAALRHLRLSEEAAA